jgi:hypothetical protein
MNRFKKHRNLNGAKKLWLPVKITIHRPTSTLHTRLKRRIAHVPLLVHGNLLATTKGPSLFQEVQGVVPILTFPAEDANQAPHLTAVVKAQSRSCRCPLVVEVPAMTSTKMIVIATAHQDAHTVLLNLRTLQLGANMMGLQNAMITPIAKPITVTIPTYWQDWDAWGTWGT